ncbi:hypothetical protein BT63DRAFT_100458 [Microthyrium microscopicum]|uniref:RING-type domain-containing protein n=1 Tax=Microthyrium microscopicum TaxID=703497 RepID=A0A6A6TY48_9PEZI|nr:hypothetical protein BT63DRAFT_100458 [Microthyrium microscopicum]
MSADGLSIVTLVFPDPHSFSISGTSFQELNSSVSFRYDLPSEVITLSTTNADPSNDLTGLLYVPELDAGSSCEDKIYQYVPKNATSNLQLPQGAQFAFLAVAPWISVTCTQQWLYAARDDPLRAFIFFLPNNETSAPKANDPAWSLGDNGKWKKTSKFPVYAIDGASGGSILRNMALYSGNLTSVPFGHNLADDYPPTAYVRLAGALQMESGTTLPSLWAFLLIVLGILIFIIASTSCLMHCIQRRRRQRLRQRVANGEVDLERLGIRRLTVPRFLLEQMPLYKYPVVEKDEEDRASRETIERNESPNNEPKVNTSPPHIKNIFTQPSCAICLDEFVPGESNVRELPCRHIFHSECVDTFLRENSSLCPLCKKSSLPKGYCPPVLTNAMVRRERMLRRMREQMPNQSGGRHQYSNRSWNPASWRIWSREVFSAPRRAQGHPAIPARVPAPVELRVTSEDPEHTAAQDDDEVEYVQVPDPDNPDPIHPDVPPAPSPSNETRTEWARRRALAMVGRSPIAAVSTEALDVVEQRRPRWRKAVGKVWPGLV